MLMLCLDSASHVDALRTAESCEARVENVGDLGECREAVMLTACQHVVCNSASFCDIYF